MSPTRCARSRPIRRRKFIAGGTNLIDLMKEDVERPSRLIDITRLPLKAVEETRRRAACASAPWCRIPISPTIRWSRSAIPLLASAILAGASAQLRNMASTGGNLMQRTRCYYFYDTATPCNKRDARQRLLGASTASTACHAILGASDACIATHPSDMCVALAALGRTVHVTGPNGERTIAFADFHRLPGDTPQRRHQSWRADEIITAIELPPRKGFAKNYTYLKIRDRLSYAFALVSVAAALELDGDTIKRGAAWRSAASPTSPGAISRPKRRCAGRRANARAFHARRRRCCCATPRATRTTPSRSIWRAAPSCGR